MDTEIAALASTAAATMVTLLTTDAWTRVKTEITALWRRFRPEHAAAVAADLDAAREEALAGEHMLGAGGVHVQQATATDASVVIQAGGLYVSGASLSALWVPREAVPGDCPFPGLDACSPSRAATTRPSSTASRRALVSYGGLGTQARSVIPAGLPLAAGVAYAVWDTW